VKPEKTKGSIPPFLLPPSFSLSFLSFLLLSSLVTSQKRSKMAVHPLTSMSLEWLPGNAADVVVAGTMGLLVGGATEAEQCMLGDTGSIFTMAGDEPRQMAWDRTTGGGRRGGEGGGRRGRGKEQEAEEEECRQLGSFDSKILKETQTLLTGSVLVQGGQGLQDEGLCGGLGLGKGLGKGLGLGGGAQHSGLDGRLGAEDGADLQR